MVQPHPELPYMPDYGVGAGDWTPLPWSWALDRLGTNRNYWVVTVAADQRPHALPVWGVWDAEESRFAFSCGPRSRKARNLERNPRIVVMTDDTVDCLSIEGTAAPVTDADRTDTWIGRYLAKYQPHSAALDAAFLRQNLLVEVTPDRAFGVIEREDEFSTRATRWRFTADPSAG